jgi:hypothetical protein
MKRKLLTGLLSTACTAVVLMSSAPAMALNFGGGRVFGAERSNAVAKIFAKMAKVRTLTRNGMRDDTVYVGREDPVTEGYHNASSTLLLLDTAGSRKQLTNDGLNLAVTKAGTGTDYYAADMKPRCYSNQVRDEFAFEDNATGEDPTTDARTMTELDWSTNYVWWGVVDGVLYSPVSGHSATGRDPYSNKGKACAALFNVCQKFASPDRMFRNEGGLDNKHCLDVGNHIAQGDNCKLEVAGGKNLFNSGRSVIDMCNEDEPTWCELDGLTVSCAASNCVDPPSGSLCTEHVTCTTWCATQTRDIFIPLGLRNKHCNKFAGEGSDCIQDCRNFDDGSGQTRCPNLSDGTTTDDGAFRCGG